jgi:hypothetical protein
MPSDKPASRNARDKTVPKGLESPPHARDKIVAKGPESPVHVVSRSPLPQGRKTKAEIIASKILPGIYLRSCLCQGSQELIFITNQTFKDDAFTVPLQSAIMAGINGEGNGAPVSMIGLTGTYYMRKSLDNPEKLTNAANTFQRKAFLRILDEDETSSSKRLQGLQVIKRFMEEGKNNQFHTSVFVQPKRWDITPDEKVALPKLDHFLQYSEIVKIIREQYEEIDEQWAARNHSAAMCFFTEGHIPFQAHLDLGFPVHLVMPAPDHEM